jgi:integrase/recombinase XerD
VYADYHEEIRAELADEILEPDWKGARLPAVPTRDEVRMLLAAPTKVRDGLLLQVLYSSGMRGGEVAAFKWCDVTPTEHTIFVRDGKGDKGRVVCVDPETMQRIQGWRKKQPLAGKVFGLASTSSVKAIVKAHVKATGLEEKYAGMGRRFSTHTLRHAYATHCYENGMRLFTLQTLLGHVFIETTRLYVHIGIRQAVQEYGRTHELARHSKPRKKVSPD